MKTYRIWVATGDQMKEFILRAASVRLTGSGTDFYDENNDKIIAHFESATLVGFWEESAQPEASKPSSVG